MGASRFAPTIEIALELTDRHDDRTSLKGRIVAIVSKTNLVSIPCPY